MHAIGEVVPAPQVMSPLGRLAASTALAVIVKLAERVAVHDPGHVALARCARILVMALGL